MNKRQLNKTACTVHVNQGFQIYFFKENARREINFQKCGIHLIIEFEFVNFDNSTDKK